MGVQESSPPRRRSRWPLIAIGVTAAVCVAALLFRTPLCARYWAWRIARATGPADCGGYVVALCNAGDGGRWGVNALLADDRGEVRQYGVLVLQHARTNWGRERLLDLLTDADTSIQELAALGLALRGDDAVIPTLKWHYETGDAALAAGACRAFELLATPDAFAALAELAVQPADVERRAALVDALDGIGTPECVPALLALLTDDRVCPAPSGRSSPPDEMLGQLRAAGYAISPASATAAQAAPATIGERAAAALARITGNAAPYSFDASEESRAAARRQWADWWAARRPER